jgi:hypothetical protein
MYPLEKAKAVAFLSRVAEGVAAERVLLIAEDEKGSSACPSQKALPRTSRTAPTNQDAGSPRAQAGLGAP